MTATDTGQGSADVLADKLRGIDRRLDALAELVGSSDVDVASTPILREVDALATELRTASTMVDLTGHDDPFATAKVAVAVRQERLGFIRVALAPGSAPEPVTRLTVELPFAALDGTGIAVVGEAT